ncbi:MarR family transcriptional regulator [Pseudodesulfovibrio cashew]|uniref:MarR family transcriptional regulator n=1 Tax=Pseudodesulfovibrio cashew TaxID=2678688 RepID=A0A6I6JI70_9BACT|nr:MarR family transcriptional regulator [Pseudodesulfovibrio cashew]QGY41921.1 MarR family transcriptional regulator [Pseudodesulfovibrio cashew]
MNKQDLIIATAILQAQLLKKIDQHLSVHGISFSEFLVMHFLNAAPHKTMRRIDLAESIGLSASGVTRLVNPMVKNHLVEKESNPRDARVSLVKLSETGANLFKDASASFKLSAESILKPLDDKQTKTLAELIEKLL